MKQKSPIAVIEHSQKKRQRTLLALLKKQKGQALILVPEVAMLNSYRDIGTIYHGGLRQSEKKEIWKSVQDGSAALIIGTQKALFLPFQNLAAIIIDEEQYESHKHWSQYPRLHTVRGAHMLAGIWGAQVVYGSSYPSLFLRHRIANNECKVISNNSLPLATTLLPFSFEDRKWKRAMPNDAASTIRAWARKGKNVLVLYAKKDNAVLAKALFFHLGAQAKKNITLGTTALLTTAHEAQYDYVVWVFPEFTMRIFDYRSYERARMLAARLQQITLQQPIALVTRNTKTIHEVLETSDAIWEEKALRERRLLSLPPFTDMVRLTVRDKNSKKAHSRALDCLALLREKVKDAAVKPGIFGPFQEHGAKKSAMAEYHILVTGDLNELVEAYANLPINAADVDPQRII